MPPIYPPGAGDPLSSEQELQQTIQTAVDSCQDTLAALQPKLDQYVKECLAECGTVTANCESCLRGKIAVTLDESAAKTGKCLDKLTSYAYGKLASAHSYVADLLGPLPDVEVAKLASVMPSEDFKQIVTASVQESKSGPVNPASQISGSPFAVPPGIYTPPKPVPAPPPFPVIVPPPGSDCQYAIIFSQSIKDSGAKNCCGVWQFQPYIGDLADFPPHDWQVVQCYDYLPTQEQVLQCEADHGCLKPLPVTPPPPSPPPSPAPPPPPEPEPKPKPPEQCCPVPTADTTPDDTCLAPPEQKCTEPDTTELSVPDALNWNTLKCPDVLAFLGQGYTKQQVIDNVDGKLGLKAPDGTERVPDWDKALWAGVYSGMTSVTITLPWGLDKGFNEICNAFCWAGMNACAEIERRSINGTLSLISDTLSNQVCALPMATTILPLLMRGLYSFIDKWLGVDTKELQQPWTYILNTLCPTVLPTQSDVHVLRSRGLIDEKTWRCWTRAIGNTDKPQSLVFDSTATKPPIFDALQMWRREFITSDKLKQIFQWQGFRTDQDVIDYVNVTEQIPGPSDLVRFMVRDVADPAVVAKYQLNLEFDQKFQGDVKRWAEWQGLADNVMEYNWYAHWIWPSPNQLYEMLFRLRPDSPNRPSDVAPVTLDDVKEVLGIQDYAPVWRARLAAIAQRPLTRVDIRRMHQYGILSDKELIPYYMDLGYSHKDASGMAEFTKELTRQARCKVTQYAPPKTIATKFVKGLITYQEAFSIMETTCLRPTEIDDMLGQADLMRQVELREERVKAIKRRYTSCEFDANEAVAALLSVGVQQEKAATMVDEWKQTACAKGKEATAAMLCKWYAQGILSATDYLYRLRRLGYSLDDATHIVASCAIDAAGKAKPKGTSGSKSGSPASPNGKK